MFFKLLVLSLLLSSCATMVKHNDTITLNGIDQNFNLNEKPNILADTSSFSFSLWIKPQALGKEQDLIAISTGSKEILFSSRGSVRITKDGRINAFARSTDDPDHIQIANTVSTSSLKLNSWNHITTNFDLKNKNISIHVNANKMELIEKEFNFKNNKTPKTPSHSMAIGSEDDGKRNFFQGSLRNIEIRRSLLSEEKILKKFTEQL